MSALAAETVTAFGPGRVNLIGEHTDYNAGLAMPFAIDRGVTVKATPADRWIVDALDLGERDEFETPAPAPGWRAFARGMIAELAITRPRHLRRSPATSRRAAGFRPRRRSRPRSASRSWANRPRI